MKTLFILTALAISSMPTMAAAQSAFDGTWKIDVSKAEFSPKPTVIVVQGGMFECKSCTTPFKIKADGTDQPIPGDPYADTLAVTIVNDHEIDGVDKKDGKVVATSKSIVAPDGKSRTFNVSDSSSSNGGPPVVSKIRQTRVADGPPGSHAVSGSWRTDKVDSSDNGIVWTYKIAGNELTMSNPMGQSYTAKLDGTEAPMKGDPGTTSVSVKMLGKNTLEETDKRDGKVIGVWRMTVSPNGKSAKAISEDKLQNATSTFAVVKQ